MRRKILLIAGFIGLTILAYSQSNLNPCVTCNNNIVNFDKYSSALGDINRSIGQASIAGGFRNQASGDYSLSLGSNSVSSGIGSISLGDQNLASGMYSLAIGRFSQAPGDASCALGYYNIANGSSSYLLGQFLKSGSSSAYVIGIGAGVDNMMLQNNISSSLMVGFNSIYPTFFVKGRSSTNNDKTGKVGIGNITSPSAKLHIKADDDEDASVLLQPVNTAKYAYLYLGDDQHYIRAKPGSDIVFQTSSLKNFLFNNGKVITTSFQLNAGFA